MRDWAHSRRLGTPADEAGSVVLRQPQDSIETQLRQVISPRGTSWEPFGPRVGEACRAGKGGKQGVSARPTSEGRGKKTRRGGARNCGELAYGDSSQRWRRPSKPWKNRPDHPRK